MKNNIAYDQRWDMAAGGNEYAPAWVVYERGSDDCDGHAILQAYLLEKNGWDAFMIGLSIIGGPPEICNSYPNHICPGHNVAGIRLSDGKILILDVGGRIIGPFGSLSDVALHYIENGAMWDGGSLRTVKASAIDRILIDITNLPWEFHDYPHRPDINPYDY